MHVCMNVKPASMHGCVKIKIKKRDARETNNYKITQDLYVATICYIYLYIYIMRKQMKYRNAIKSCTYCWGFRNPAYHPTCMNCPANSWDYFFHINWPSTISSLPIFTGQGSVIWSVPDASASMISFGGSKDLKDFSSGMPPKKQHVSPIYLQRGGKDQNIIYNI